MGKSTISTGPFSIARLNYQRVEDVANCCFKPSTAGSHNLFTSCNVQLFISPTAHFQRLRPIPAQSHVGLLVSVAFLLVDAGHWHIWHIAIFHDFPSISDSHRKSPCRNVPRWPTKITKVPSPASCHSTVRLAERSGLWWAGWLLSERHGCRTSSGTMGQSAMMCTRSRATQLPSGKHRKSYWTWPFIVDLPVEHGDFPYSYVSLPEGISWLIHPRYSYSSYSVKHH